MPTPISQVKATNWSVTINNYTPKDDENIAQARQKGWSVEGQKEICPTTGTPHYQLFVKTKGQQRGTAMKKAFPRGHIEVARNVEDLKNYVHKPETADGVIPGRNDLYPSLQTMWDMFYDWLVLDQNYKEFCSVGPDAKLVMFDKFIGEKITQGYVLETMAVNPQMRSCVKLFGREIAIRSKTRRQTADRQTAENIISSSSITANGIHQNEESHQSAEIPQTECDSSSESVSTANESDSTDNEETNGDQVFRANDRS